VRLAAVAVSLVAIGLIWAVTSLLSPPVAPVIGRASAIDGDTLAIGRDHIRLIGLDAPELDQRCGVAGAEWACGREARSFLADLLRSSDSACAPSGRDRYGRLLARCSVAGDDVGHLIVAAGWAVASSPAYEAEASEARAAGRGVWSGPFASPAEWRRGHGDGFNLLDWLRGWFR
jgi:endonuclease YncB( thermonuclease family)